MNKNKLQEIKARVTNDYELFKRKSNILSILRGISFLLIALSILYYRLTFCFYNSYNYLFHCFAYNS